MLLLVTALVASAQSLETSGSCPGTVSIDVSGISPGGRFGILQSDHSGTVEIPFDLCEDAETRLLDLSAFGPFDTTLFGTASLSPTIGSDDAGIIQVIDLATCGLSARAAVCPGDGPPAVLDLDVGPTHGCVLLDGGEVQCWGSEGYGMISGAPDSGVSDLSVSSTDCALIDGEITCWGYDVYEVVSGAPAGVYRDVQAGFGNGCAIDFLGSLTCWGWDLYGQVTDTPVGFFDFFDSVDPGYTHICGIRSSGGISCWGWDDDGQCSDAPDGSFTEVAAGQLHSCALDTDGALQCWGSDRDGNVSDAPGGSFTQLDAGWWHTCAINTRGGVQCWGRDTRGQVSGAPLFGTYVDIATDGELSCALDVSGAVRCWGNNDSAQAEPFFY